MRSWVLTPISATAKVLGVGNDVAVRDCVASIDHAGMLKRTLLEE